MKRAHIEELMRIRQEMIRERSSREAVLIDATKAVEEPLRSELLRNDPRLLELKSWERRIREAIASEVESAAA